MEQEYVLDLVHQGRENWIQPHPHYRRPNPPIRGGNVADYLEDLSHWLPSGSSMFKKKLDNIGWQHATSYQSNCIEWNQCVNFGKL